MASKNYAQIAQSVEQRTENPRVTGSIPVLGTLQRFFNKSYYIEKGSKCFLFFLCRGKGRYMKKADKILILVLLIAALGFALFFFLGAEEGGYARITEDGVVKAELPLSKDTLYRVETASGYNIVHIQDGFVTMYEADCRDQICVEHKKIHLTGESIVCLPHKLVVEIIGEEKTEFDSVVG